MGIAKADAFGLTLNEDTLATNAVILMLTMPVFCRPFAQRCEAFLQRKDSGFSVVAEVVRLLGDTKNARILTNPATEMLHSVALWGILPTGSTSVVAEG